MGAQMTEVRRAMLRALITGSALSASMAAMPAQAQTEQSRDYRLEAQSLDDALRAVGKQSGRDVMFPSDAVAGKRAPRLEGRYTFEQAIRTLLVGSGLEPEFARDVTYIRGRGSPASQEMRLADDPSRPDLVVTGSRIRGSLSPSPQITLAQRDMIRAGQTDLGQALRSLPQNFTGGQNPGIGPGAPVGNSNQTGSSAANLRGLGADATLTILNGHRIAFGTTDQSVDISAIPLRAVEAVDVVTDGSSAIYGSDAVGGVVNIRLKPDYDGLSVSGRIGTATDGGNVQQQYSAVGGRKWSEGGFIATYDFGQETAVRRDQRDYLAYLPAPYLIYPRTVRHSAVLSGHQALGGATAKVDLLYNNRTMETANSDGFGGSVDLGTRTQNYLASATLEIPLAADWQASLTGSWGKETSATQETGARDGAVSYVSRYRMRSDLKAAEAGLEGPLFTLPARTTRLALGGGFRRVSFFNGTDNASAASNTRGAQQIYYAYGEVQAPLLGAAASAKGFSLQLNGAYRFEQYDSFGDVLTPKLGLVARLTDGLWLKGSWGRSFKAPTLQQMFLPVVLLNYPPTIFGGRGFPATATVLYGAGGNRDLEPERARTWQISVEARPLALPGLFARLSYYDIDYKNRVATPIQNLSSALSDPNSQQYVTHNPSVAQIGAFFPESYSFYDFGVTPYDPANVVALIYNRYFNAARQSIRGIDLELGYRHALLGGTADTHVNLAWIESSQVNQGGATRFDLAGTVFHPADLRARIGESWSDDRLTLSAFVNYIAGVSDTRTRSVSRTGAMTTIDLSAQYRVGAGGGIANGLLLSLSAQNLLDTAPPYLAPLADSYPAFDTTNYSALGRVVSLSATIDL
jgi:outer membrane receptor protein involved in Fe transport